MQLSQIRERSQTPAEVLPWIIFGGDRQAANVWLGFPVRAGWEIKFGEERLETETNVDVADRFRRGVFGEEISGDDDVGEAKGEGVF